MHVLSLSSKKYPSLVENERILIDDQAPFLLACTLRRRFHGGGNWPTSRFLSKFGSAATRGKKRSSVKYLSVCTMYLCYPTLNTSCLHTVSVHHRSRAVGERYCCCVELWGSNETYRDSLFDGLLYRERVDRLGRDSSAGVFQLA